MLMNHLLLLTCIISATILADFVKCNVFVKEVIFFPIATLYTIIFQPLLVLFSQTMSTS